MDEGDDAVQAEDGVMICMKVKVLLECVLAKLDPIEPSCSVLIVNDFSLRMFRRPASCALLTPARAHTRTPERSSTIAVQREPAP